MWTLSGEVWLARGTQAEMPEAMAQYTFPKRREVTLLSSEKLLNELADGLSQRKPLGLENGYTKKLALQRV